MLNCWISYIKIFLVLLFLPRSTFTITIDVVIPCHSKDKLIVKEAIKGIRENGKGIRRIIVVSKNKLTEEAEWFDENKFPFNKKKIALIFSNMDQNQALSINAKISRKDWLGFSATSQALCSFCYPRNLI